MNDICIVSFGKNYNFERGLDRLKQNIENTAKLPFFGFKEYPSGCPTHEESPFAFKFYCINECVKNGFKNIIWLDSSVIIKNNLSNLINHLNSEGYFFIKNWHSVGDYCHDKALKTLGITRDESFNIPSIQGTNFGLNFNYDNSNTFLHKLLEYSKDGITFPGPYDNKEKNASLHPRVLGHRHEQTAMSVTALKLGMNKWFADEHFWFIHDREYVKNVPSTVIDVNMCEQ